MSGDAVGGVWRYALELAAGFSEHEIETVLAIAGPAPEPAQLEAAHAIPTLRLATLDQPLDWMAESPAASREAGNALRRLIDRTRAESTHLNMPAHAAGSRWPTPLVAVAHSCLGTWWRAVKGGPPPADFAWRSAETGAGLAHANGVIAPSASFAAELAAVYGTRHIRVVHNGLDRGGAAVAARQSFVLTAGRLWDEGKNIAVLDRAARQGGLDIRAAGPVTEPGGTPKSFAHLRLLGNLTGAELERQMAMAALFAAPSRYEPFGLAVLEAALARTPLVLADIPSFRELWQDAAVFVPAEDVGAWAAAISRLLADGDRQQKLGRAAAERARRYSRAAMVAGTLDAHRAVRQPLLAGAGWPR